jgi:hypothetical protein
MSETHYKKEILVINLKGTSWKNCSCGSWIKHWEKFSGEIADECSVEGCNEPAVLGAHIKFHDTLVKPKDGEDLSNKHFIVPMCYSHNNQTVVLTLKKGVIIVKANKSETCGQ